MVDSNLSLKKLGLRLRSERLKRNESQAVLAARIGVSVPTFRKMEAGDPSVTIGHWSAALDVLDRIRDLEAVLAEPEDLFVKYENTNTPPRHRASKRLT
jgi:transcriptional regulator with XRE-family HTH domain